MTIPNDAPPDLSACCPSCGGQTDGPSTGACAFEPDGVQAGLAAVRAFSRRARLWSERNDLSLRVAYPTSEEEAVRAVIAAEAECCPFLRFDLQTADARLIMTVVSPEHARDAALAIFDAFENVAHSKAF